MKKHLNRACSMLLVLAFAFSLFLPFSAAATEREPAQIARSIAEGWLESAVPWNAWQIADMASAEEIGIFTAASPDDSFSSLCLTDEQKQDYCSAAINKIAASDGISSGDLAQQVLVLTALKIDARRLTTSSGEEIDAVSLLAEQAEKESSIYALPYLLLALRPYSNDYPEETDCLIHAIEKTPFWGYEAHDPDGAGPALLALSPYYRQKGYESVTEKIDEVLASLKANVALDENGTVSSWGVKSAESTALLIVGLTSLGYDPNDFFPEKSLETGLLSMVDAGGFGFVSADYDENWQLSGYSLNEMATEQGFRALISLAGFKQSGGACQLYDFSGYSLSPASAFQFAHCPVTISTVPSDASVSINGASPVYKNCFDLPAGSYSYVVSHPGYQEKIGVITIALEQEEKKLSQFFSVSLSKEASADPHEELRVSFTLYGDTKHGENVSHTFKEDSSSLPVWIKKEDFSLPQGSSVFDLFDKALTEKGYEYEEPSKGYLTSISQPNGICLSEQDNSPSSGWLFQVNGRSSLISCRDYILEDGDQVVWFYSDDYTKEQGSEQWSGGKDEKDPAIPPETQEERTEITPLPYPEDFQDVSSDDWFAEELFYMVSRGIFKGSGSGLFSPAAPMTRAMMAAALCRIEGVSPIEGEICFTDIPENAWYKDAVLWAYQNGIAAGYENGRFEPDKPVSRQEAAVFLYRYALYRDCELTERRSLSAFSDEADIAPWARAEAEWAYAEGLFTGRPGFLFAPDAAATRAEAAAVLARFCQNNSL